MRVCWCGEPLSHLNEPCPKRPERSPREVADRIVNAAHEYEGNDPGSGAGNFLAQVRSALAEQAGEDLAQEARERNSAAAYEASEGKYGQPLAEQAGEERACSYGLCDGSGVIRESVEGTNIPLESGCPCRQPRGDEERLRGARVRIDRLIVDPRLRTAEELEKIAQYLLASPTDEEGG